MDGDDRATDATGGLIGAAVRMCSFCGRNDSQVEALFRGLPTRKPYVYICDECIHQCYERLCSDREKKKDNRMTGPNDKQGVRRCD